jgi:Ras-related protein Rab-11A
MKGDKSFNYDMIFKIVLIGDASVGKTNILSKYLNDEFDPNSKATVGVEFATKNFTIEENVVKAQIWDTAGQERYRSITSAYYKGAKGCLLVYDITRKASFETIDRWISELKSTSENNLTIILIGNKCDLENERQVTKIEGEEKAKYHNMAFIETSALNGTNLDKAFDLLIKDVYKKNCQMFKKEVNLVSCKVGVDLNEQPKQEEKKGCCG